MRVVLQRHFLLYANVLHYRSKSVHDLGVRPLQLRKVACFQSDFSNERTRLEPENLVIFRRWDSLLQDAIKVSEERSLVSLFGETIATRLRCFAQR